jgi:hypothetical protein
VPNSTNRTFPSSVIASIEGHAINIKDEAFVKALFSFVVVVTNRFSHLAPPVKTAMLSK